MRRLEDRIRHLESREADRIDSLAIGVPAPGNNVAATAGVLGLIPFDIQGTILARRFATRFTRSGAGSNPTTIQFALYQLVNPSSGRRGTRIRPAASYGDELADPLSPRPQYRRLHIFQPVRVTDNLAISYIADLPSDLLLRRGTGYALAYICVNDSPAIGNFVDAPPSTSSFYVGYRGAFTGTKASFAPSTTLLPAQSSVAPYVLLRSSLGIRLRPFATELSVIPKA